MNDEEQKELQRQSRLLESLEHNEAFVIWRKEVADPILERIEMALAQSDTLSEPVLRANVKLHYLVKEMFYQIFDRVKLANQQDKQP